MAQPLTPDQVEAVFHRAVVDANPAGVEAALRVMLALDPRRAVLLYDGLKMALALALTPGPWE